MNHYREPERDLIIFVVAWVIISLITSYFIYLWLDISFSTISKATFLTVGSCLALYAIKLYEITRFFRFSLWPVMFIVSYAVGWWGVLDELSNSKWPFYRDGFLNPNPEWYAGSLFQWISLFVLIVILYIVDYATGE
ncbi:hypothetical protein TH77_02180 [Salmonella enterica]|nr:hypothetical protein [Salmonella enterica]